MGQDLFGNCPSCHGKKHIPSKGGFTRCPECFVPSKVARILKKCGYPEDWARLNLAKLTGILGPSHPVLASISSLIAGDIRALHLYSTPSAFKQTIFAVALTGVITAFGNVIVYDSADLAAGYFKSDHKPIISKSKTPVIFILGREIESKLGGFYFRAVLEHCCQRQIPLILFTDGSPEAMSGRYPEFMGLYKMAGLVSCEIVEGAHAI